MSNNLLLKDGIHSLELKIIIEDKFQICIKIVEGKKSVIFFKPNNAKIHLTLFSENDEYKSHVTKEGKKKEVVSYSEVVAPINDMEANYLDHQRYFENIAENLRLITPKEHIYFINFTQYLLEMLDFMINNKLFSITCKPSSKGYEILTTYNISSSTINKAYKIMKKYVRKIKAKRLFTVLSKQNESNYQMMTKKGKSVIILDNNLYCVTKSTIIDDLKNTDFHYFDFLEKIFHIFHKNLPGIQFDPVFKSVRKYLIEIYKSLN